MVLQDELQDLLPRIPVRHWDLELRPKPARIPCQHAAPLPVRNSTGAVMSQLDNFKMPLKGICSCWSHKMLLQGQSCHAVWRFLCNLTTLYQKLLWRLTCTREC